MEGKLQELLIRIEYIEKLIDSLQQWLILSWGILAVIVTILSVTITILVKKWVDKKVEEQLESIRNDIMSFSKSNPQFYYSSGKATLILMSCEEKYTKEDKYNRHYEYTINVRDNFSIDFPTQIRLYYKTVTDKRIDISKYKIIEHGKNYLRISHDTQDLGDDRYIGGYNHDEIYYEIIWENPVYQSN